MPSVRFPWELVLSRSGEPVPAGRNQLCDEVVSIVPYAGRMRVGLAVPQPVSADGSLDAVRELGLVIGGEAAGDVGHRRYSHRGFRRMSLGLLVILGVLGLVTGSFLNVVIYRVPRGESLVAPPSHCPSCGAPVKPWDNVPVLSWVLLRGRCRNCHAAIGVRYPLVELLTAAAFVVVSARLLALDLGSAVPAFLYFTSVGIALAAIDIDVRRLPDSLVLPSYPVLAALLAGSASVEGDWWPLARSGIGAAVLFAIYFVMRLAYPAGMGLGDVKLAGLIGGVLGYVSVSAAVVGGFAAFPLGAVVGLVVIASRGGGRKTALPFGPFMLCGAAIGLMSSALSLV